MTRTPAVFPDSPDAPSSFPRGRAPAIAALGGLDDERCIDDAPAQDTAPPNALGGASAPAQAGPPPALKILILEDESTDAELMQRELRKARLDFTARRVDNHAAFVAALETFQPDVLLVDYKVPGCDGAEALAHVRHVHPEIPVVIVSGTLGDEAAIELLKADAKDYVLKSYLVRLPSAVERAIAIEQGIRARKASEAALHESQQLIEGILNAIPVRVFWKDRNLVYLGCNAAFARDAGFASPADIVGKDDYQMGWRDQAGLYRSDDRQVIESGCSKLLIEEPQTTPKGATITLLTSKIPLRSANGEIEGVLGTYMDITEHKQATQEVASQAALLATEHELSPDGILVVDRSAKIVSVNHRFSEIFQVPAELIAAKDDEPVLTTAVSRVADSEGFLRRVRYLYDHPEESSRDEIALKDGRVLDRHTAPMRRADGDYLGRVWFFRDITDRIEAERAMRRLNRTLTTLSRGNEVLVHATSEPELLKQMCRVMVETGGYRMAWIGIVQHDAAKSVTPIAWAGEVGEYLETAQVTWADEPHGRGPAGRAIRTGEPQVTQNLEADPSMAPWQEGVKERMFASAVVFPLKDASGVFAALMIYSPETDAFSTEELKLLQELANDLAFGIRSLREHTAREALDQRWRASLEATVGAIANTVEMRDPYTAGHQQRVARLATAMARELDLPEQQIQGLYLAGIIHDVGKIDIPAEILNKPGKLSKLQFQLIQAHAQSGYDIVKGVDFPWSIAEMVLQHHERLDGSGYPQGLKGEAILPDAKILAVADVVEAMISHRPYRPALGIDAALAEIEQGKGQLYDPAAVEACTALFRQNRFSFT